MRVFEATLLTQPPKSGVFRMLGSELINGLKRHSQIKNYQYIELDGKQISSKADILNALETTLNPPFEFRDNWDAFASEIKGLAWIKSNGVTIVYKDFTVFQQTNPKDFEIFTNIIYRNIASRQYYSRTQDAGLFVIFQYDDENVELPKMNYSIPFLIPSPHFDDESRQISTSRLTSGIINDLSRTLTQIDEDEIEALETAILDAKRIFVAGKGRSGLQMRAFAMRLMHLGLTVHVVDDVTTPSLQSGDLLIIGSGSGRTASLVRYAEKCETLGAKLALITGNRESPIAEKADAIVSIPASNFKSGSANATQSTLIMGSLFEHTLGLLCDLMTIQLKAKLDADESDMNHRHANLE